MNKIFKVIWSKSKQCYIVVSEIAKNKTGKKKIVIASILAALAMAGSMQSVEATIPEGSATGTNAFAIGPQSNANGDFGFAIGNNAKFNSGTLGFAIGVNSEAKSNQSIAIGYVSKAIGKNNGGGGDPALAVGAGANATAGGATAIGMVANASNAFATAIGKSAAASGDSSIAIGNSATITAPTTGTTLGGQDSIAMGNGASANQHSSVSVGLGASSNGVRSVAIGPKASATDEDTIAIGTGGVGADKNNQAVGNNGGSVTQALNGISGVELYYGAKSTGKQSIAIGYIANAKDSGIAIGNYAVSDSGGGTAMGKSVISRNGGVVVGQSSNAIGQNSVAYGNTVKANGENSTAMGYSATADGQNAVAVGYSNTASGKNSVSIGSTNQAKNEGSLALGRGNNATNNNAVVIGRDSNASGNISVAMGANATSKGTYDTAIGNDVTADGDNSVAIGRSATTKSSSSLAIGTYGTKGTSATGAYSIAMGRDVTASAESAIAIGKDAVSNKKDAVALGSGSDTSSAATVQSSTTIGGKTYSWTKGVLPPTDSDGRQVSVGKTNFERQIKNVAAGEISANSTDAINGAQLYSVASGLAKDLKVPYVSIKSGAIGAGSNFDNNGAQASDSIAIGPSSSVTRQNGIAIGNGAKSLSEESIVIGRNAQAETKAGAGLTTTSRAIAIGSNSRVAANVTQGIAIGSGLSPDEGAVVTGDQSIAIGGNVKVDGHAAIAIGGDDAKNASNQQVSYTNKNDADVTGTLKAAILDLTGYDLSNYKGTTAGHAGVAYGTSALAGNAGVAIGTASDSMTRKDENGNIIYQKDASGKDIIDPVTRKPVAEVVTNAVAIGTGARANFGNSVAIGGGSNTDHYATKQVNAIIDGIEVKWAGGDNISPGDVVSFGSKGFERQLKNVAPGEVSQTSTDAINGSQIYSLARKVTNIMNGGAGSVVNVNTSGEPLTKVVTGTGTNKQTKYYRTVDVKDDGTLVTGAVAQTPKSLALVNVDEPNVNQQTQTPRTLGNVANGVKDNDAVNVSQLKAATVKYFSVNSTDAGNRDNTGATGTNAIAIGPTAKSTAENALAIGNNAQANSNYAVALGHYANNGSTNSTNSISIGWVAGGSSNGASNVAIGTNAGKQVTGNNNISLGNTAGTVNNANVYTSESILLGTEARVKGSTASKSVNSVIAIGKGAEGSATSATSIGINANASAENAMALGSSSKASVYNGVALGSYSEATTEGSIAGYNANTSRTDKYAGLTGLALTANTGAVSIGSSTKTRQITNLAAGTNDTDAVNVAQLKSVNLAVKGNSGAGGDVNLATNPLTIKGNDDYITTSASGNTVNISGKVQNINVSNGNATATTGMADAKNVAEAINKAVSQNAYTWNLTADNDTAGSRSTITKEGTVKFSGDQNITVKRDGNTITSSLNKSIIVDSVKANNSVTTGSGANQITLDGTSGAVTGKTFSGQSFTAGNNVLSNTTLQIGSPTNGDNNVTITKDGLTSKAGTKTAKFGATGIDAGGQQIANVSSGGNVGTNAANITDVKNAVADVTLKLDTNSKTGTVKLSESPLKVIGANGIRTDLVGTNNGSLVVGLDQATVNATTKGIGLTGDTGSTGNKYLKDGDVSFAVTGDGNLVSTSATTAGVKVAVNAAKVKDLAVEAVTVSKDSQVDNPITVTPTAGTNSKDYSIGIDTTKLAGKTDLTYRANNDTDANAQKVSLAKGLNFVNGDNTVATVAADGKVSYDLNASTKIKIDDSAAAVARNISLGADNGTASSQSLKDGDVAFNVKGATGDYVSTNMNGNTVEISTTRATINSDANTGAASVTGNDGLATAKNVADAINKAADAAKAGAAWNVSTNGDAGTKVSGGDTVDFTGDNNITVTQTGKNIATTLNKDLKKLNSISLENGIGETIKLDATHATAKFMDPAVGNYTQIDHDSIRMNNGIDENQPNTANTYLGIGSLSLQAGPNSTALDSKRLIFNDEDGNIAEGNAKGFTFQSAAGKQVEFGVDEIKAGGNKIQEVDEGTADTDAVNVKQLKDTVASQTLTYRANTATDADAKSVKLSKGLDFVDGTSTVATVDNDGKVSFDLNTATKTKIDDSATAVARNISLGADSGTASSQSLKDGDVAFNVKGATGDYVSTNMNGNTVEVSTKRATIDSDANTGAASVIGNDGLATAKNVADAINKAADAAKAGAAWNLTTNSSTTDKTSVQGGDTVDLINGDNILITQDGTDKKKITVATKKDLTVDSVTAGNTVINTSGLTNGTTAITGSGITTDKVTVGGISIDKTDGINAGGKAISNVASGGTTDTNAANIGDVKQAVANLSQNLNITDGTNNGTVDLKNQKLNVAGANGVTATVNNQTITVGLDADTVNATTKGIGLTADTGSTGNKYLKDGDVSFAVVGDGNLVSTSATAAGVKVAVDAAKVKDLAVDAVTVSKDAQADNPITVTPTAGTNSKDYAIGIDTAKLAGKTDLTYRANNDTDVNAKKVSLAKGLNFVNGTLTTASIDNDGVVKYDVNTATITAGADGTVTGPTTDGVATAQNVADAINAAKKAAKTEVTANTGEAANATTGNVTLTSTTAADGHTIYDVKLNDTVTLGTGTSAVTMDGTTGKVTAKNASVGGVTIDGDNKHVTGLSNTTWNGMATTGRAATEDQLKAVADTAKATTDAVNLKFSGDTNTSAGVVNLKDDTFNIVGDGKYVTTDANGKDLTVKVSEAEVKKSAVAAVTVSTDTTDANNPISVTPITSADGTTKEYKVTIDGTKIANKTNLSYKANDGTAKQVSLADGLNFKNGTLTTASIDDAGVVKYDVNTAVITAGTDGTITGPTTDGVATAQNVADAINAAKKAAKTEVTANTGEVANATTGNVTLTSTTAADGHTIYDVKLNDKVTLGTGANAVTLDGVAGTVKTGAVTVTGGTINDITGLSNTTVNSADFATRGRAATEEQLKAVGEQTWQITADKDAATSGNQTGTKKDAKVGKDDKVQLIAGENLTVNQNERDFTFSLNKDLVKMNSATFLGTGGKTTVITGDSIAQTDGTKTNTSTATGNTITDGTNTTEATASTITVKDNAGNSTVITKDTITTGTGANKVTVDGTTGKVTVGSAVVDGVNNTITTGGANAVKLDGAAGTVTGLTNTAWTPGVTKAVSGRAATEDQLQQVSDAVGAGWNVNTGTVAGSTGEANGSAKTKVSSGEEVQLQAGNNLIIDQNGKTLAYSLNKNLKDLESATFNAVGGKTTVIKGDSIVQTDGSKTNTSNAAGNTVVDGAKSTATTAVGTTITDGAKTNTSTADKNVIDDGAGNKATFTKDGVTITKPGKDTVSLTGNGLDNGNNKIVNVADGTNDTDAVNVRQLDAKTKAATTELTANGGESADNTTGNIVLTKTTAPDGHIIYDNKLNDKITLGVADPTKAITIDGTNGTIKAGKDGNAVAINGTDGTIKAGDGTNAVAIDGVNGSVKVADKIALNGKDGKAAIGTVGIDGKDGIIITGGNNPVAVNGKDGVVTGLTNKTWDPNNITSGRAATEDQVQSAVANAGWDATVGTEGSGVNSTPSAIPEKIRPNETLTFKAGNNMMVSHVGKTISYAVNPELTDMKSATFKDAAGNTTVMNGNGMVITPGSANPNNPNAGPVSLTKNGLNNGNNQIKGVAPGSDDTDAVNIGQLKASNAKMGDAIGQVAGEVQRVGAHAAAMAALKPIQYDPLEPTQIMAGIGNYRGETAGALGLAHYTNEDTMFNVGVSVGGNHNMVNAGVTHKFGSSPEKKNIPDRYKAGPISSVYVMQDEVSSLKKENAEQKYVIADQAARLNTLEAENERQRQELAETKQGLDDLRAAVDRLLASKG